MKLLLIPFALWAMSPSSAWADYVLNPNETSFNQDQCAGGASAASAHSASSGSIINWGSFYHGDVNDPANATVCTYVVVNFMWVHGGFMSNNSAQTTCQPGTFKPDLDTTHEICADMHWPSPQPQPSPSPLPPPPNEPFLSGGGFGVESPGGPVAAEPPQDTSAWKDIGNARNMFGESAASFGGLASSDSNKTGAGNGAGVKANGAGSGGALIAHSGAEGADSNKTSPGAFAGFGLGNGVGRSDTAGQNGADSANAGKDSSGSLALSANGSDSKYEGAAGSPGSGSGAGGLGQTASADDMLSSAHGGARGGSRSLGSVNADPFAIRKGNPSLFEIINRRYGLVTQRMGQ